MGHSTSVLLVDDDEAFRSWFARAFSPVVGRLRTASSLLEARSLLEAEPVTFAVVDFNLPDGTGDELIRWALTKRLIEGAFCMTAYANCRNVVSAMRAGAIDVLDKTSDTGRLAALLTASAPEPPDDLAHWRRQHAPDIIGTSPALLDVLQVVQHAARTASTVLLLGESGTGKEQIACAVHHASGRRNRPFVAINCAAIPETLIESELFGHARGAFTGAQAAREGQIAAADGGTLFLDEIGDMPMAAQSKLLRVLQERRLTPVGADRSVAVDIRVVAATHRDLDALVESGAFREDLYYRLSVIRVELPPLRERLGDVLLLARFFLARLGGQSGSAVHGFEPDAEQQLASYDWPGNIRQLANAVERALAVRASGAITIKDLQLPVRRPRSAPSVSKLRAAPPAAPDATPLDLNLRGALEHVERQLIDAALARTGGNRTEAAALLGLNRSTLLEKMRKLRG